MLGSENRGHSHDQVIYLLPACLDTVPKIRRAVLYTWIPYKSDLRPGAGSNVLYVASNHAKSSNRTLATRQALLNAHEHLANSFISSVTTWE